MLDLYRRHTPKCPHRAKGQGWTKCSCPIWCDGTLNGKRVRRSVGLRDWARAVKRIERWEAAPPGAAGRGCRTCGSCEAELRSYGITPKKRQFTKWRC